MVTAWTTGSTEDTGTPEEGAHSSDTMDLASVFLRVVRGNDVVPTLA